MDFFSELKAFLRAFIKKSPKFEEWSCAFPEICKNPRFFRDDAQKAAELRPFDLAADEMQRGFDVFFTHVEDGGQAWRMMVAHRANGCCVKCAWSGIVFYLHFIFDAVLGERFLDAKFFFWICR